MHLSMRSEALSLAEDLSEEKDATWESWKHIGATAGLVLVVTGVY